MFCGSECDFFCLISKQLHVLLNLNRRFAGACDLSGERPRNWFGPVVSQVAVDSQQSWIRRGQREIRSHVWISNGHCAGAAQKYPLPYSGISVRHERNVHMPLGVVLTKVFPVDPVKPAICQLNSVLTFEALLGSDLHRKNVLPSVNDEFGNVELETVIHPDCSLAVSYFVPIQPDISPIIDALKDERVDIPPGRSCECCAVPPVLLP